ncbi:hypothetical protein Pelo_7589 [Pelomyxa schiedti]|nr:hypothetical protein Pelo_7589 [Pelomyxa schiedti]
MAFGRDWVVARSRWLGTTVVLPPGEDLAVHVFVAVSATLGVVSCGCLGRWRFTEWDERRFGSVQECVGAGRFAEDSSLGSSCIVDCGGAVAAALEGDRQLDGFGSWAGNKRWLVRLVRPQENLAPRKIVVWRMSDGVPVSRGVVVRCTVPLSGEGVRLSPFDPCGDVIAFVGMEVGGNEGAQQQQQQRSSSISFVDLGKSIEAGVTVVVSKKSFFLPPCSSPFDLVWSSPGTILILYRGEHGEPAVYNTVTGHSRSFPSSTKIFTVWPAHLIAQGGTPSSTVSEVYCVSSDLSQPSCRYEFETMDGVFSTSKASYCVFQVPEPTTPTSSSSESESDSTVPEVSIGDAITGQSLAVLTVVLPAE